MRVSAGWGRPSPAPTLVYGAAAVLFVALAHYFAKQVGDDSFIFYRVADNVLHGWGPVFNEGDRVEAYSSPLWLAVLTLGRACGPSYATLSVTLGDLAAAFAVGSGAWLARALGATEVDAALAALFATLSGSLHYWAPAGLEMSVDAALVGLACVGLASSRRWLFVIATALVGVARPEGILLVPFALGAHRIAHGRRALSAWQVAVASSPAALYEVFRVGYFGEPFPNTYYAKATGEFWDRVGRGLDYACWTLVAVGVALALAARVSVRGDRRPIASLILPTAIVGAAVFGGGDWMWGHRLLVPALAPLFGVLAALPAVGLPSARVAARTAAVAGVLFVAVNDDLPWPERLGYEHHFGFTPWNKVLKFKDWRDDVEAARIRFLRPVRTVAAALIGGTMAPGDRMEGTMTDASFDVASWLRDHYPAGSLVAVNHAGAVPFYSRFPTLDMTGLADRHIARDVAGDVHRKYDPRYVLSREPVAIVLNTRVEPGKDGVFYHPGYWEGETALVNLPEFKRDYRAVPTFFRWEYSDHKGNFILIFERAAP